jgi:CubicO group peptidase (beta-lactamase class C family)
VVVLHHGRPVYERYDEGADADTVFNSFSVGKSFTSTLVGILVDRGDLALDDPAPVPEWADPDDPRHEITLRHLLHMASGLQWNEGFGPAGDYGPLFAAASSGSAGAYMAAKPLEVEPGTRFEYSTGTSALLARIVGDVVGFGDDYRAFLSASLTEPLGLENPQWLFDASGAFIGGLGADMNTRSFARFGLLYLRGGEWDGERVVSSDWVDFVQTPSPSLASYGGHFWLGANGYSARGAGGQEIYIDPGRDVVVAVNSGRTQTIGGAQVAALFDNIADPCDGPNARGYARANERGARAIERAGAATPRG